MRFFTEFTLSQKSETLPLRFTQGQGDTWRRVQNDKHAISLIVTQPLGGEGKASGSEEPMARRGEGKRTPLNFLIVTSKMILKC